MFLSITATGSSGLGTAFLDAVVAIPVGACISVQLQSSESVRDNSAEEPRRDVSVRNGLFGRLHPELRVWPDDPIQGSSNGGGCLDGDLFRRCPEDRPDRGLISPPGNANDGLAGLDLSPGADPGVAAEAAVRWYFGL